MRKLLLLVFLIPFVCSAQVSTMDSLKLALKNAKYDTTRCRILNAMAETESDELLWPKYNEEMGKLAQRLIQLKKQDQIAKKYYAIYLNNKGFVFVNNGQTDTALVYFNQSLQIQEEINDFMGMGNSLQNIADIYKTKGNANKAIELLERSILLRKKIKDNEGLSYSYNNLAMAYKDIGDIQNAILYYHEALKIHETEGNKKGIAIALINIGVVYKNQNETKKALEYYTRSLKIQEELKNKKGIAQAYNSIGALYNLLGNTEQALNYLNKSLSIREELIDKEGKVSTLINLGFIYKNTQNYLKAMDCFTTSLKLGEELKNSRYISNALNNIGSIYLSQNNYRQAENYGLKSLTLSKQDGYPDDIEFAANMLKTVYQKQNKYAKALEMLELETVMRDSISNEFTRKASIKSQFKYEYEKKAAADSVQHAEEQKVKNAILTAQQAQLKQEKTQRIALYGGLVLVIAFLGFVINRFRVTQKQKIIIEQQKVLVDEAFAHLEEKNKEVMDSIHYAKRIQTALLTSEKYIEKTLNKLIKN